MGAISAVKCTMCSGWESCSAAGGSPPADQGRSAQRAARVTWTMQCSRHHHCQKHGLHPFSSHPPHRLQDAVLNGPAPELPKRSIAADACHLCSRQRWGSRQELTEGQRAVAWRPVPERRALLWRRPPDTSLQICRCHLPRLCSLLPWLCRCWGLRHRGWLLLCSCRCHCRFWLPLCHCRARACLLRILSCGGRLLKHHLLAPSHRLQPETGAALPYSPESTLTIKCNKPRYCTCSTVTPWQRASVSRRAPISASSCATTSSLRASPLLLLSDALRARQSVCKRCSLGVHRGL